MTDAKEKKFFDEYFALQMRKIELAEKEKKLREKIREHRRKKK